MLRFCFPLPEYLTIFQLSQTLSDAGGVGTSVWVLSPTLTDQVSKLAWPRLWEGTSIAASHLLAKKTSENGGRIEERMESMRPSVEIKDIDPKRPSKAVYNSRILNSNDAGTSRLFRWHDSALRNVRPRGEQAAYLVCKHLYRPRSLVQF